MPTTYSRVLLSGSTNGKPIPVAATASPGTTIHTAVSGTTSFDSMHLWATNVTAGALLLTIQFGGTTDTADDIVYNLSIPANSPPVPLVRGQCLNNGLLVRAWCNSASGINITGHANRIVP